MALFVVTPESTLSTIAFLKLFEITFAITWGVIGAYINCRDIISAQFNAMSGTLPLTIHATLALAISAFSLVFALHGFKSVREMYLRHLMRPSPANVCRCSERETA